MAPSRKQTFVLLRYVHIAAGSYLLLWSTPPSVIPAVLVVLALASNVALAAVPERHVLSIPLVLTTVTFDLAWLGTSVILTGHISSDLLILYVLVVLAAATGESLGLIAGTAAIAGLAYLAVLHRVAPPEAVWTTPNLIRVPFLFAAALACGYLVQTLRGERRRVAEAARLTRARGECLAAVVADLQQPVEVMMRALDGLDEQGLTASPRGVKKGLDIVRASVENVRAFVQQYLDDLAGATQGGPARPTRPAKEAGGDGDT